MQVQHGSPDFTAQNIDEACEWIAMQIPQKINSEVSKVVLWNSRKVVVKLSNKASSSLPKGVLELLKPELRKNCITPPKVECLTFDKETLDFATIIANSLWGESKFYSGALIIPSGANPSIGLISVGTICH